MAKRYRIDVEMNLRRAESEANRMASVMTKAEEKIGKAAEKTQAAMTRAAERQARARQVQAEREARDADRLAEKRARLADREADRAVKAAERAARERTALAEREARLADRQAEKRARLAEREADRSAKAAERAAQAAATRAEREAKAADKLTERRTRLAERESDRAAKAAEKVLRDKQRAADQETKREEKKIERLEKLQDQYIKKEYSNRVRMEAAKERAAAREVTREARKHKQLMNDADVALAVQNKAIDNANKKRVRAALDAAGVERKTWSEAIRDATGFTATMTKMGAALIAVKAIGAVVSTIAKGFVEAQQKSKEFFDDLVDTAADLRELATINEKGAPDPGLIRQHIELRRATGMTRTEATGFATELGNALGVVGEDRLSKDERAKLVLEGGKFAARGGGGPEAIKSRASILALLANYLPKGSTAKDDVALGDAVDVILGKGSASQKVMTEQYRDVLTAMTSNDPESQGMFKDPRQAAALTAIASGFDLTAPAHASMMAARQARKFTNFRKMKGMTASATETLTKAGVTETDDPVQSMVKMFEFAKANMGKDEAFDAFLARRGFREAESNRNLMKFYERWKQGDFGRVMDMAKGPIDPNAADRKYEVFAADPLTSPLLARQRAQTAKLQVALERQPLESAKLESEEAVTRRDVSGWAGVRRGFQGAYSLWNKPGRDVEIEEETIRRLQTLPGASKASVPLSYRLGQIMDPLNLGGGAAINSITGANDAYIEALKRNTDAVAENNRLMRMQNGGNAGVKGQAPLPLSPAPPGAPGVL